MFAPLDPREVLLAYTRGAFPMDGPDDAWNPAPFYVADPRAVLPIADFRVPRSVSRALRRAPYEVFIDRAFGEVVDACAVREEDTWLTPRLRVAYRELHRMGHAHSVECWEGGRLVGGLFGVAMGALFTSESMFHRAPDAGNIAMVATASHLLARDYRLWDIQMVTPHTLRFGAQRVPHEDYMRLLGHALRRPRRFTDA